MSYDRLDETMQSYIDRDLLSCIDTLVLRGTEVVHRARFGYLDIDSRTPLPEDAIFRVYSNTKLITSVALMMLFEAKRFELDDPIAEYLPAFAKPTVFRSDATSASDVDPSPPILMRQVLSHSAGFSYGFIEPNSLIDKTYAAAGILPLQARELSLEELCDKLATMPLAYVPGTSWRYSLATDVCARLVEVLSGQSFGEFLQDRIFTPLGMVDTDFWVPPEKRERFTAMYAPADLMDPTKPGLTLADDPLSGAYTERPRFESGGGGLVSTMNDYVSFIRMLVGGGTLEGATLLTPATLALMRTNQLAPGVEVKFPMWSMPNTVFGLGFALKTGTSDHEPDAMVGEYHWGGMAGTHSWMSPSAGVAGLCFTQRMPGFWHPFSHDFKREVYAAS